MTDCNVYEGAHRTGVKKLLFSGSSCIYARIAPQLNREEYLMTFKEIAV